MAYRENAIPKDEHEDLILAELRMLRERVDEQAAQLVEMDVALEGRIITGARFLEVRRKHAVTLPRETLETYFHKDYAWRGSRAAVRMREEHRGTGKDAPTILRPMTYYCSGEIEPRDTNSVSLTSAGLATPIPGGIRAQTRADTNFLRTGDSGFPRGVAFLATSWYARWDDPEHAPNQEAAVHVGGSTYHGHNIDRITVDIKTAQRENDCLLFWPPQEGFSVVYEPQRLAREPAGIAQRLMVFLVGVEGRLPDAYDY